MTVILMYLSCLQIFAVDVLKGTIFSIKILQLVVSNTLLNMNTTEYHIHLNNFFSV